MKSRVLNTLPYFITFVSKLLCFLYASLAGVPLFFDIKEKLLYLDTQNLYRPIHGALLPVSFFPLALLVIIFLPYVVLSPYSVIRKPGVLLCIFLLVALYFLSHSSLLKFSQLLTPLLLLIALPFLLPFFTEKCFNAGLIVIVVFALLHLASLILYQDILTSLDGVEYFYGYRIHSAFVSFPDGLVTFFCSSILALFFTQSRMKTLLYLVFSCILLSYPFIFGRITTLISIVISLTLLLFLFLWSSLPYIYSLKLNKLYFSIASLSIVAFSYIFFILPFANVSIVSFNIKVIENFGVNRTNIYISYLSYFVDNPIALFFGGGILGDSHNLLLELVSSSGLTGTCAFFYIIYVSFRSIASNFSLLLRSNKAPLFLIVLMFFVVNLIAGNLLNQSLTQPYVMSASIFFLLSSAHISRSNFFKVYT